MCGTVGLRIPTMSKSRKTYEQRLLEQELYFDRRYRAKAVSNNKGRSREKQKLRRMIEENDYDKE